MIKKLLVLPAVALFISMSISSCSKCKVCTKDSEPETRICEKDYNSNTEYGFAVDVKESQGFACKGSL
jgi:hypothetical protein